MARDDGLSFIHRLGHTMGVLLLLLLAAAGISYLWAYGLNDALIAGNIQDPSNTDPNSRPHQLALAFASIMSFFLLTAFLLRCLSARQLRRIDAMSGD